MKFNEKTLSTNYIYKGKIINLKKDEVELIDGKKADREVIEHSGGACVVCEKDGKVLLVNQFRYPYGSELLELPAGKINPNEAPEITAIRELEEEGGIKAEKVELLFKVYPSPGYTNEIIYVYKATGLTKSTQSLDDGEFLDAVWVEKEQLRKMIKSGEIKDGKTLIGLLAIL